MTFALQTRPEPAALPAHSTHDPVGFELGWDHAHYRASPPAAYLQEPSALRHGLQAGQAAFGKRTLEPARQVQQWLQLRLHAWLHGRSVELVQVTPHFLGQLDVSHCPILRAPLCAPGVDAQHLGHAVAGATRQASHASVDRVRNDAGYAAGNLAVMSVKANHAKASFGFRDAWKFARRIEAGESGAGLAPAHGGIHGLNAGQWGRVAVLCSFVEPLAHGEACGVPMLLLPPNRVRLFNPAQALQAFICRQLLTPGWSQRISRFEDLLPEASLKRDFNAFFMALLPRVLEAGKTTDALHTRWAVEDAWRNPLVLQRWGAFARRLSADQCEALVQKAHARQLGTSALQRYSRAQSTEGWNLEGRGYAAHEAAQDTPPHRSPPRQLLLLG